MLASTYHYLEDGREEGGAMGGLGGFFFETIFEALAVARIPTIFKSDYSQKHD